MSLSSKTVDLMNPVVLRESRQLVRSRFAVGILMVFLLIMVISAALYVVNMGNSSNTKFSHGKNLFQILYYVLGYACMLFIPAYTAVPLLMQKQSTHMDLLMVSTIPPRSVIWGKMTSALWMITLFFSVSLPFMVLTVLLRGIGLFEVIYYLLILGALILMATMGFLLLACLPTSRVFSSLLSIGYLLLLILFPGITANFHRHTLNGEVVLIILGIAAILLPIGGALATGLISPSISNRSMGIRVTTTCCWIISGIICAFIKRDAFQTWAILSCFGSALTLVAATSEPSIMSRRVQRTIPKKRILRLLAFPWFTGALNGWIWALTLALISIPFFNSHKGELSALVLYALMYSLLAIFVRRLPGIRRVCLEKYTWAIVIALGTIGSLLPIIAHFIAYPNKSPDLLWKFGNPFSAVFNNPEGHISFTIFACIILFTLNLRWILQQIINFHPPKAVEKETEFETIEEA